MVSSKRVDWRRIVQQAIVAGIAGAIVLDLYLWLTTILPAHGSILTLWVWIASTVFGKAAFTNPSFAWAGLAIHAIVSIGWAGGFAYLAAMQPAIYRRWLVSGFVYGLVVYAMMQIILLADNNFTYPHTPNDFVNALAAHAIFFGIPVAYLVNALKGRPAA
jgi:hypothetical protein